MWKMTALACLSTLGMHLRTAISSRLALVQRGQMSGSICWITFRPAQSAVNWDTFKTNSGPLSGRMSTNTSSGLNVRFLKKLFSHLAYPWTLWSSASPQGMSLKAFPQNKRKEKKNKIKIFVSFVRIICVECAQYNAEVFHPFIYFHYFTKTGYLFISLCPLLASGDAPGQWRYFSVYWKLSYFQ